MLHTCTFEQRINIAKNNYIASEKYILFLFMCSAPLKRKYELDFDGYDPIGGKNNLAKQSFVPISNG